MTDLTEAPLSELSTPPDTDCRQAQQSLLADLCGDLDDVSSTQLMTHLRSCRHCLDSWLKIQAAAELAGGPVS